MLADASSQSLMTREAELSVLTLVDLSSIAPRVRTAEDLIDGLLLVRDLVDRVVVPPRQMREVVDVDVRIYGGFFAHNGTATEQYAFLLRNIARLQGLSNGVRIRPTSVAALACRPAARIIGTYRDGRQRMVDQMLAQDARFLGPRYDLVGLLADDEDYFPMVLALATEYTVPVRWVRQRPEGRNDAHLTGTRVSTLKDAAW